jgi:N-acetylmuramoyl-L-alanine amidase
MVKYYLYTILALILFGVPAVSSRFGPQVDQITRLFGEATSQFAAVILSHNPKSITDIQAKYNSPGVTFATSNGTPISQPKVRILLVPGHEPDFGGTEFGSLKERDMTVELAQDLSGFLANNDHYQVITTRDHTQWLPTFANYFKNNWQDIIDWEKASAKDMAYRISIGSSTPSVPIIVHNRAPNDVAYRLYGITKWANENDIDITIHIHFNDDTEHPYNTPGSHSGFAIYVPEHQYGNSTTSRAIAETIFKR